MSNQINFHLLRAISTSFLFIAISHSQELKAGEFKDHAEVQLTATTLILDARDPRPLAQAAEELSRQFHWRIDYEDPVYDAKLEARDITRPDVLATRPQVRHQLIPSGGNLSLRVQLQRDSKGDVVELPVLHELVVQHSRTSNPGRFALVKESDTRYALSGRTTALADSSILDARVVLPEEDVTPRQRAEELGKAAISDQRIIFMVNDFHYGGPLRRRSTLPLIVVRPAPSSSQF